MSDDLEHVMERIARVTSGDAAVDLVIRGDRAYAKDDLIVLPSIEKYEDAFGPDVVDPVRLMHGLADHEIGHAADSDFDIFENAGKLRGRAFQVLFNTLEDGYIEGRRGTLFPGCRYNLAKKNAWYWSMRFRKLPSWQERIADSGRSFWMRFLLALGAVTRPHGGCTLEQLEGIADAQVLDLLREVEPVYQQLEQLYPKPRQTHEVEKLALAIWEKAYEWAEPSEDDPDEPEEGEPGDEDEDGSEGGASEDEGGPAEDEDGPAEDEDGPAEEERDLEIERFTSEPAEPLNPEEAIVVQVSQAFEGGGRTAPYTVFDQSFDIERDFSGEWTDTLSARYEELQKEAAAVTDELTHTFEAALQDREMRRLSFDGDEEGEVDPAMLPAFSLGAQPPADIWVDFHAEQAGGQAAVAILIDCSGSMGNGMQKTRDPETGKIVEVPSASHVARLCAIASHEALKRAQIPHEINGFTTLWSDQVGLHPWAPNRVAEYSKRFGRLAKACAEARRRGTKLEKFARTYWRIEHPLHGGWETRYQVPMYGTFKGFDHDDGRGLVLVAGISNNLDGEAVLWQARRLAHRPERRKVMVVLSDGFPAGSHDNLQGARYLSESVKRAMGAGIEVYGIGIVSDAVRRFYPHWEVVNDLAELPAAMIRALTETIVEVGGT